MPEAKQVEPKMQGFDDIVFTMTSFSAKRPEKIILLDEEKDLKA